MVKHHPELQDPPSDAQFSNESILRNSALLQKMQKNTQTQTAAVKF